MPLSIVPSWNWNVKYLLRKWHLHCYQSYHRGIEISDMGIKQLQFSDTINRTIVELKYENETNPGTKWKLSIVPSWNWNRENSLLEEIVVRYQSYHRGIEIFIFFLPSRPGFCYQSYHRGIEICAQRVRSSPVSSYQSYHRGIEITRTNTKRLTDMLSSNSEIKFSTFYELIISDVMDC